MLSALFCFTGNSDKALYVLKLGLARDLADLMASQYTVEQKLASVSSLTWDGVKKLLEIERESICLYLAYHGKMIYYWILKANKEIRFEQADVNKCLLQEADRTVNEGIGNDETFRVFQQDLDEEQCEDRSGLTFKANSLTPKLFQEERPAAQRLVEEEKHEKQHPEPTLEDCYNMIIAPVLHHLKGESEIIIVPDSLFFKIPFAAMIDKTNNYLSETFRIRILPSLMTLKLIQDSPPGYHEATGLLIVGDPAVGHVHYNGKVYEITALPFAREEAKMVGQLLGGQPLLGEQATKQTVLQSIKTANLIHFAAHSNPESGEIFLAPPPSVIRPAQEKEYLLNMIDVAHAQLRAKLVVLSCCHSARGQIRAEGVVGIARAFLGSGARSVLVALWAIEDRATKQFMSRFYEHLVRGESASESIDQARKWMRKNGFSKVGQWAPFMLVGDNVTIDFGKQRLVLYSLFLYHSCSKSRLSPDICIRRFKYKNCFLI